MVPALDTHTQPAPNSGAKNATPRQDAAAPVIDLEHLGRYTMSDAALEREILQLFIETLKQTTEVLAAPKDVAAWNIAAHTLKGSARAVGAWRLAELMEHAEATAEQSTVEIAQRVILTDLEQASADISAFIARLHTNAVL